MAIRLHLHLLRSLRYLDDHTVLPGIESSQRLMVLLPPRRSAVRGDDCPDHRLVLHDQAGQWYQGLGDSVCGREDDSEDDGDSLRGLVLPTYLIHSHVDDAGDRLVEARRVLGCVARGASVLLLRPATSVLLRLSAHCELDR